MDKNAIWDRTPPTYTSIAVYMCGGGFKGPKTEFNYLDSFKSYGIFSDFVVPTLSPSSHCRPRCPHVVPMSSPHRPHSPQKVPMWSPWLWSPWSPLFSVVSVVSTPCCPCHPHVIPVIPTSCPCCPCHLHIV